MILYYCSQSRRLVTHAKAKTSGSAIAEGPREALVSRNPATTNISLVNPIVWHYLRDSTFSRFDTIPDVTDTHTHTQSACRRTDTRRRHIPHLV